MAKATEQKYFERLNISTASISKIKHLIKVSILNTLTAWEKGHDLEKQTFHIIGPAGVGKTQICGQISRELSEILKVPFETKIIKAPVLSRDDFIIPFPVIDNGNTSFKMLYSDFVPKDPNSFGLFIIDECNRGDHSLQQLLWQVQNEYKLHLMDFPKGWFVIALDNPDDQEYSVDNIEDAAGLRRMLHIYTEVSVEDFLKHAISSNFHPFVIEFIQTNPHYLYDYDSQKQGSVYANPASYERVSNILWNYELSSGIKENLNDIEILLAGLINIHKTRFLIDFIREKKGINPKDIFYDYEKKVREKIIVMVDEKDNASLGDLMISFSTFLVTSKPKVEKKELENIVRFLTDVPVDTAAILILQIDGFNRDSDEFKYFTKLQIELIKNTEYKEKFYNVLIDARKRDTQKG